MMRVTSDAASGACSAAKACVFSPVSYSSVAAFSVPVFNPFSLTTSVWRSRASDNASPSALSPPCTLLFRMLPANDCCIPTYSTFAATLPQPLIHTTARTALTTILFHILFFDLLILLHPDYNFYDYLISQTIKRFFYTENNDCSSHPSFSV